jgi:hypothetical protein
MGETKNQLGCKLGYDIQHCGNIVYCENLKSGNEHGEIQAHKFLKLYKKEFTIKIGDDVKVSKPKYKNAKKIGFPTNFLGIFSKFTVIMTLLWSCKSVSRW